MSKDKIYHAMKTLLPTEGCYFEDWNDKDGRYIHQCTTCNSLFIAKRDRKPIECKVCRGGGGSNISEIHAELNKPIDDYQI